MVIQKTAMYKVLVVVMVFMCWFQWSLRVKAEEHTDSKYIMYEDFKYYANGLNGDITNHRITYRSYYTPDESKMHRVMYSNGNFLYSVFYSYEPVDLYGFYTMYQLNADGSIKKVNSAKEFNYIDGSFDGTFLLDNGVRVYYYFYFGFEKLQNNDNQICELLLFSDVYENLPISDMQPVTVLKYILNNGLEPDIPFEDEFVPTWTDSTVDPLLQLINFQAEIVEDNLVMKWDPIMYSPYRLMENIYIRFRLKQRPAEAATESNNRRNNLPYNDYCLLSDYELTIPLSDLEISENYILSSVNATPYYYIGDDVENELKKGNSSYVYFNDDGTSSSPIVVDPVIDPDVDPEDVEGNIFKSIQNFFSGFFRNLLNTVKTAVVPDPDDVLSLLSEMNDWFSERFGFIWYPFDLAIDIVAAFAIGEPDSKITIPAFSINILGGVKLWDSFQADLDPVDFLKYVRFFTSAIMCCGTVSLAIRKWDEWIGGEH